MASLVTFDNFTKSFFKQPDGTFVFYKDEGGKESGFTLRSQKPITSVTLPRQWVSHLSHLKSWSGKDEYFWKGRIEACSARNNRQPFVITVNKSATISLLVMSKRKIHVKKSDMACTVDSKDKSAKVFATLCYRRLGSIRKEMNEMRNELKKSVVAMDEMKKSMDALKKDTSNLCRSVTKEIRSIRDEVGTEMMALEAVTGHIRKLAAIACVDPPEGKRAKVSGEEYDIPWVF